MGRLDRKALRPAIVLSACLSLAGNQAAAHSFYDPECCGEQDCEPISESNITFLGGGKMRMRDSHGVEWLVNLNGPAPASRPPTGMQGTPNERLEAWRRFFESQLSAKSPMLKTSPDGAYHLCIYANRVHCVYLPAGG